MLGDGDGGADSTLIGRSLVNGTTLWTFPSVVPPAGLTLFINAWACSWPTLSQQRSGAGVRQLRHHFGPIFAQFSAPHHLTRAVCHALLCVHADLVLIGAWNPMLCPIWGFRTVSASSTSIAKARTGWTQRALQTSSRRAPGTSHHPALVVVASTPAALAFLRSTRLPGSGCSNRIGAQSSFLGMVWFGCPSGPARCCSSPWMLAWLQ